VCKCAGFFFLMEMTMKLLPFLIFFAFGLFACTPTGEIPAPQPSEVFPGEPPAGAPAPAGPAIVWSREGGIAGFCQQAQIKHDGLVMLTDCKVTKVVIDVLNAERQAQLTRWLEQFAPFEYDYSDPASADALTVRLTFNGLGENTASEQDIQEMNAFISSLFVTPAELFAYPEPVTLARADLAARLQIAEGDIRVQTAESVDWPNACIGVEKPDTMCAEVITPGYRVIFEVNGTLYTYHTDAKQYFLRVGE
jgi:hypothetical protein